MVAGVSGSSARKRAVAAIRHAVVLLRHQVAEGIRALGKIVECVTRKCALSVMMMMTMIARTTAVAAKMLEILVGPGTRQ